MNNEQRYFLLPQILMGEKIPLQELDELISSLPAGRRRQFAESQRGVILEMDEREHDAALQPRLQAAGLDKVIEVKEDAQGKILPGQLREGVDITDVVVAQRRVTDERVRDLLNKLQTMDD